MGIKVAVGYDGSDPSKLALRWAAEYAMPSKAVLSIIHAWIWPIFTHDVGPVKGVADSGLRHAAEAILSEGVELAREISPDMEIEPRMVAGLPADVLRQESRDADLLVVGNRGLGGFFGKLVGSVSADVAAACPCPVVVIRAEREEGKPVIACVDGQVRSSKVLEQSVRVAQALETNLRIVHVDPPMPAWGRHAPSQFHGRDVLRNAMLRMQELDPGLAATEELLSGHSVATALVDAGADAELLVLGAHRREGHHPGTLNTVLTHARCNVMIAR
ncbi:nucleotide-binding universal stress UspA family protein [Arthrobacter sp. V4I6]|uniref:universal stress protein n=1 Tax=unclassified Arthrobacter TaxID=235627 RepID=UPI00277FEAA6|nr:MULTISPECIES: universal stress protein [unclassified Arthrobacter]MDQ0821197.1 nucleotide-binding universal stress UspA family protein [Arthrobacter sp. V1I7]MDQ0855460.1 nucleotide-binding universal stress UspA family protein [Arthrobacter sp. V4I6]